VLGDVATTAAYYAKFAWRDFIGNPIPIVGGLSVTDVCNLDCRHCWRKNSGGGHQTFDALVAVLRDFHERGVRYLYVQGGEPYTWRDGAHDLRHIVRVARDIGFFHVSVCTNGTFPLEAAADTHWVSLDGLARSHDAIRGGFDRVVANVRAAARRHVCANVTLNTVNVGDLRALAEFVASLPGVKGMMVNFHIPLPGVEALTLDTEARARACAEALALKNRGLPILNTRTGLAALARNRWPRPMPYSIVSDGRETWRCCRANGHPEICERCGYAVWAELALWRRPRLGEVVRLLRSLHGWRAPRSSA
jgi:MoaA/NifB/PqqE/SkfB family radical SAM enzyme